MKILHTADWHLGKNLHNFDLIQTGDQAAALDSLLEIVAQEQPDVILVAGDIYDRSVPPADAVSLFDRVMSHLIIDLRVPVIAIAGNHDSPERINYCNYLLTKQGLHISGILQLPIAPVIISDAWGEVYFYPIPYTEPETLRYITGNANISTHQDVMQYITQDILAHHPAGKRKVLIGHAFIAGGAESRDSERLLVIGGAAQVDARVFEEFDYAAWGHLHRPQSFLGGRVNYAGALLKYSADEADSSKSVSVVALGAQGEIDLRRVPLVPKRDLLRVRGVISPTQKFNLTVGSPKADDFLEVTLENETPVPNAMHIIQREYPNTFVLKWAQQFGGISGSQQLNMDKVAQMNELQLFDNFYQRFSNEPLNEAQIALLQTIVQELHREAR